MFDTNKYSQTINIKPACSGTIQKSSPFSRIVRCAITSRWGEQLLSSLTPHIEGNEVIILQVMVFGDNQCLIEFVDKDFYKIKL